MFLALEKLDPTTLQDKNALAVMLQGELYSHGDETSLVSAAAWSEQQGLVAVVCYEQDPDAPHLYIIDCQTGEMTQLDSSGLNASPMIEDISFSPCNSRIDLGLVCTKTPRQAVYDLGKRQVLWI